VENAAQIEIETDPGTDKILQTIAAVENLRAEKVRLAERVKMRLAERVKSLEHANLRLKSEVESLKLAVEDERAERRHYRQLADEIITRLDIVGQTIDDVVERSKSKYST
jgi:hypothetical protein